MTDTLAAPDWPRVLIDAEAAVATVAAQRSGDPDAIEAAEAQETKIVKMSGYLSRRVDRRNAY